MERDETPTEIELDEFGFPARAWLDENYLKNKRVSLSQMAVLVGKHRSVLWRWLVREGIVEPRKYAPQGLSRETLHQLHVVEGLTAVRIAALLGYNHASVSRIIKKYQLDPGRPLVNHTRDIPVSRDDLQALRDQGLSCRVIGERYGVPGLRVRRWLIDYQLVTVQSGSEHTLKKTRHNRNGHDFTPEQRRVILDRDGWRCQMPGCACAERWKMEVHHVLPVEQGGTHLPTNGITLCHDCHGQIKRKESQYITLFQQIIAAK